MPAVVDAGSIPVPVKSKIHLIHCFRSAECFGKLEFGRKTFSTKEEISFLFNNIHTVASQSAAGLSGFISEHYALHDDQNLLQYTGHARQQ